jgi:acyl-homoserine lactone acylase PvdQ
MSRRPHVPRASPPANLAALYALALAAFAVAALTLPAAAAAQTTTTAPAPATPVLPYAANDAGGFRNVLPPGTNGLDNVVQLAAFEATGQHPAHSNDQLSMYSSLIGAAPNITDQTLPAYFKDATFGVPAGQVASTETPEPGVVIERDKAFGVPHIYGTTRDELMFGIGYATGEDRLFFVDALRHVGRGDLAGFAGGANVAQDEGQFLAAPYTEQDLQAQVDSMHNNVAGGAQIYQDATQYVDGLNAYIDDARLDPLLMPGEYAAIGQPGGPQPFKLTDLVAIASLVGAIFGKGGGDELQNAILYQDFAQRFGPEHAVVAGNPAQAGGESAGPGATAAENAAAAAAVMPSAPTVLARAGHTPSPPKRRHRRPHRPFPNADLSGFGAFLDFRRIDDPQAPTTVHDGARFPYDLPPGPVAAGSEALPDPGSVEYANPVTAGGLPAGETLAGAAGTRAKPLDPQVPVPAANEGLLAFPRDASNALLVSARDSASGHPLAVMGPQVGYFSPQILMEEDIHGPGIDADGAAFAGLNLYVELGHGTDYAWSATSADQDIIDTFALPLCNPTGGAVSESSSFFLLQGQCQAIQTLTQSESWTPNLADPTPAGSVSFSVQRTPLGIVIARATIGGRPVVYTTLRSTYMHELDSATGFAAFNDPAQMQSPADFMTAASKIGYTFNWFYTDSQHIAYFNSGNDPVRAPNVNPLFPVWADHPWAGWSPATNTAQQTPANTHPQVVDQDYLTSWNNKAAPGAGGSDQPDFYSSVYRSQLLDAGIRADLAHGHKMTLASLVDVMGTAATQDLRGVALLPWLLKVIGTPADPALAAAVRELAAWSASGAHILPAGGRSDSSAPAIELMDAWYPLLVQAILGPTLGPTLLAQVEGWDQIDDRPNFDPATGQAHAGSSWDVGFYGLLQRDLRSILGTAGPAPLSRIYCGEGLLARCRSALLDSLKAALAVPLSITYPADGVCTAGDVFCADEIRFRPIGAVSQPLIAYENRPTFQQADEILGQVPPPP